MAMPLYFFHTTGCRIPGSLAAEPVPVSGTTLGGEPTTGYCDIMNLKNYVKELLNIAGLHKMWLLAHDCGSHPGETIILHGSQTILG